MASQTNQCLASLAKLSLATTSRPSAATIPRFLAPSLTQSRSASAKAKGGARSAAPKKTKKTTKVFRGHDTSSLMLYSLCDAMRYARAYEVGRPPASIKYEVAINLVGPKSGRTIRNRLELPYPVSNQATFAVICKEDSPIATAALRAGAVAAGEESLFEKIRAGDINFTKLLCDKESSDKLTAARLGRILGPKGLMPTMTNKMITDDIMGTMKDLAGADEYRERQGTIRMAAGKMVFTPEMLSSNISAIISKVREDLDRIADTTEKKINEVVLSTTNGPGFPLHGGYAPTHKDLTPEHLTSAM